MDSKDEITSILNAIDEINTKSKKKNIITTIKKDSIPKLDQKLFISPDVDRLIREAEAYKKTLNVIPKTSSFQTQSAEDRNSDILVLTDEVIDYSKNDNEDNLQLLFKIENLEKIEKKLRSQVLDLQKEKILFSKEDANPSELEVSHNLANNTKETLKSIYKQVEKQKKIFLELKNYSIKIERESNVFKENYERLIIENNEIKTRLKIAKEQIVNYEANKNDLLTALDQLNEILSKSNILGNISPIKSSPKKPNLKKETKIEPID
jgi:hypothetical protein